MRPLSSQQQQIVQHIFAQAQDTPLASEVQGAVPWGVEGDRVFQASASRSLRRLEARGLVQRLRSAAPDRAPSAHHRTTGVVLTPTGRALAQRLTAPGPPVVNQ
jgi:hypothetical protein